MNFLPFYLPLLCVCPELAYLDLPLIYMLHFCHRLSVASVSLQYSFRFYLSVF